MANLRLSTKILSSTLHKAHYSSFDEKVSQEIVKQVENVDNKAKSEKLFKLLPYLQHKNIEHDPRRSTTDSDSEERRESDHVEKPMTQALGGAYDHKTASSENATFCSESSAADVPQSLPVLIVAQDKAPAVDLNNIVLPLSLHLGDKKSLIIDAVVQDMKQVYFKTSSAIDGWYLVARSQGKTLYISAEEYINRPGGVQDFLRERVNKNAVSLYDPKLSAIANIDVNSIIEKVKQLIENITASIKKSFEKESKEEKKPEEKAGKTEKKAEEAKK